MEERSQGLTKNVLGDTNESYLFVDFLVQKQLWISILCPGQISCRYKCEVQQKGLSRDLIHASGHLLFENRVGRKVSAL